jgi:hypothetical protein
MHDLLIVFIVLLVLLTLISALGGSILPAEHFADEAVKEREEFMSMAMGKSLGNNVAAYQNAKKAQKGKKEKYEDSPLDPSAEETVDEDIPQNMPVAEEFFQGHAEDKDVVEGFDGEMWASA